VRRLLLVSATSMVLPSTTDRVMFRISKLPNSLPYNRVQFHFSA
jgi:hypothetical protein